MKQRKLNSEFAQLVNLRCRERGISQSLLADQMGISHNYLSLMKSGKRGKRVPADKLAHYATALSVSPSHLGRLLRPKVHEYLKPIPSKIEEYSSLDSAKKILDLLSSEIDARKNAEKELFVSEQRYRNIVESMTDMVMCFTASSPDLSDASIIYVNATFCRMVHVPVKQVIGSNPLFSFVDKHRHRFQEAFGLLNTLRLPQTFDTKGEWTGRWRRISVSWIQGNEYQLIAHDIHEWKILEEKFRKAEKKIRQLETLQEKNSE